MTPIAAGSGATNTPVMVQFAIRGHPFAPVAVEELEGWLQQQVEDLRACWPQASVRLSRLTQGRPGRELDIGWLLELGFPDAQARMARDHLADVLRDMRLLGLQATVLAPQELPNGKAPPREAAAAAPSD